MNSLPMYYGDIADAAQRINGHVLRTPVMASRRINQQLGTNVCFKMESFQPDAGSFKIRGAMNALLQLDPEERERGVVSMSSGNHGQAVAIGAHRLGVKATIVVPRNANPMKIRGMQEMRATVIGCEPTQEDREAVLARVLDETNGVLIHPYNDERVIAGQGTVGLELLEYVPLDSVIVPVGGGGLISGAALAMHGKDPNVRIIGAEPANMDDASRSLQAGSIQKNDPNAKTIADGLISTLGDKTFPIIQRHVEEIITVTEQEIADAMRILWERLRAVVEPSGAVAFAALRKEARRFTNQIVGVIVSGGNADLDNIPFLKQRPKNRVGS